MDGYEVDPTALASMVGALRASARKADEAINVLDGLGGGDLGPSGLTAKARDAADQWQLSVSQLRQQAGETASNVHAAGAAYREFDERAIASTVDYD